MAAPATRRGPLALVLAICAISTGAPFVRWAAPAPALAIAALRVVIASLLLVVAGRRELASLGRIARRDRPLIGVAGVLLAIHFGSWIVSLSFTSTAASTALVCTNPIFAAVLGRMLGDHVTRREAIGIAIAGLGCGVLAGGDWSAGGTAVVGDGLALVGAASGAGYLIVGRRLRAAVPLLPYLGTVNAVAAVVLVAVALAVGTPLTTLPTQSYVACAGAALIASFIGHGLLNAAVRTTPTHLVALAVLGEPIRGSPIP